MVKKGDESKEEALKRAFKFLSYRPRSEAEVRAKLNQLGFPLKSVETTLEKLHSLKLLDDEIFARGWARGRAEDRGYGPLRIERELRQKGIAQSVIRHVVGETFGHGGGKEKARTLLEKRFRGQDLGDKKALPALNKIANGTSESERLISTAKRAVGKINRTS